MQGITPFLWFEDNAEEAVNFYVSLFPNSKIGTLARYSDEAANASGRPKGSVMVITFELNGQPFMALNGGPQFKFTEAISLMVNCDTQEELDRLWAKLGEGGKPNVCGWLKDRYGLSWQLVPASMGKLMSDPEKASRVMKEVLQMDKLDIARMERAAGAE